MTNKILREIARPFRQLTGQRAPLPRKAPVSPPKAVSPTPTAKPKPPALVKATKLEDVEYLAPTAKLSEILPASDQAEIRLMTRLIRTHVWAMPEDELMVLAAVVATLKPKRIFEFGTYTGGSTLTIAANAADDFSMTTLDIGPLEQYKVQYEPGALYGTTRFAPRIKQLVADSLTFRVGELAGTMDLVFVDANHRYQWANNDTRLAFEMVRPGGVVVWHDYTWLPQHAECIGVTQTVNEIHRKLGHCHHIDGTRFAIYLP